MSRVSCPSLSVPPWATLDYHLHQSSSFLKFLYEKSSTCLGQDMWRWKALGGPRRRLVGCLADLANTANTRPMGKEPRIRECDEKIPQTKSAGSAARSLPSTSWLLLIRQIDYGMCRTILVFSSINRPAVFKKKKKIVVPCVLSVVSAVHESQVLTS